jgi:hypothetical protein
VFNESYAIVRNVFEKQDDDKEAGNHGENDRRKRWNDSIASGLPLELLLSSLPEY